MSKSKPLNGTREHLLDVAQELAQSIGINAFSYRDLSDRLGIKTASIHYHFPKKEDLSFALIERYQQRFSEARAQIEIRAGDPQLQLKQYVDMCFGSMEDGFRVCLCGMFATDFSTLSDKTKDKLKEFILENEAWIEATLKRGKLAGQFEFTGTAKNVSHTIFGLLEGVIIVSHCFPKQADRQKNTYQKLVAPMLKGSATL